jgi:hypothetical protein
MLQHPAATPHCNAAPEHHLPGEGPDDVSVLHIAGVVDPRRDIAPCRIPLDIVAEEVLLAAKRREVVNVEELELTRALVEASEQDVAPRRGPVQLRGRPARPAEAASALTHGL